MFFFFLFYRISCNVPTGKTLCPRDFSVHHAQHRAIIIILLARVRAPPDRIIRQRHKNVRRERDLCCIRILFVIVWYTVYADCVWAQRYYPCERSKRYNGVHQGEYLVYNGESLCSRAATLDRWRLNQNIIRTWSGHDK